MQNGSERREHPRLSLTYPIRIGAAEPDGARPEEHTVTHNVSARGAYFCTHTAPRWPTGTRVSVVVTVPHRLAGGGDVTLDLRGRARVVRIESPAPGVGGESGVSLSGVALRFDAPLSFHYAWV